VQKSLLATDYVLPRQTFENDFHIEIARIALTRQLGALIDSMVDELRLAVDGILGSNTEDWTEVNLSSAMLAIIMRSNARAFIGLPLCRDKTYLTLTYQYSMTIAICGSIIRILIPDVLKPIFGPIFALPCRWYAWRCNRYLVPIIKSHSANMQLSKTDEGRFTSVSSSDPVPNDLLQHITSAVYSSPSASQLHCSPHIISANLTMLNTAATHTTHLTIVHALLDLLSHYSPGPSSSPLEHIRAEASVILASHNNTWTRAAVAQLHRADSAIRESLRYTTMGGRGSMRQVTPACGVQLPSGETVPQGVWVGLPVAAIHHDAALYAEPDAYLPFRFSDEREKLQAESGGPKALEASKLAMATTSHTFLPFSHGRHACPGRFYAAQLLKLLLAELVLRYDVRGLEERPKNMIVSDLTVPPDGVSVWVKRRSNGDEKEEGGEDSGVLSGSVRQAEPDGGK
jgi:cytochrome P450